MMVNNGILWCYAGGSTLLDVRPREVGAYHEDIDANSRSL